MLRGGAGLLAVVGAVVVILFQSLQSALEDVVVGRVTGQGRSGPAGAVRLLLDLIRDHPLISALVVGVLVLFVAIALLMLWLSWRYTQFRVDATGVYLKHGVIARKERSASHDRVQSVDISLPFIPRLLGLASLVFDVAGGAGSNITIAYLRRAQAEALRDEILSNLRTRAAGQARGAHGRGTSPAQGQGGPAGAHLAGGPGSADGTGTSAVAIGQSSGTMAAGRDGPAPGSGPSVSAPAQSTRLVDAPSAPLGQRFLSRRALDLQQHAADAVEDLSGSLRELLAPYRIAPAAEDEGRLLRVPLHQLVVSMLLSTEVLVSAVVGVLLLVGVVLLGILVSPAALVSSVFAVIPGLFALVGVVKSEIGLANFTVALTRDGLRVSHGLASTTNRIIPLDRIQAIKLRQPLLWRSAGWWRAEFTLASEGSDDAGGSNVLLPVGSVDDVLLMLGLSLPDPQVRGGDARSLMLAGMLGPAATREDATAAEARAGEPHYRGRPRRTAWLDPVTWRRNAHALTGSLALIRSGRVTRTLELVPHARVQALSLRQGPIQRRLGVDSIALHLSPGPIRPHFVHLPGNEAHALFHRHAEETRRARERLDSEMQGVPPTPPAPPASPASSPPPNDGRTLP